MRPFCFILSLFFLSHGFAAVPKGCEPLSTVKDSIHIKSKKLGVYYFHNMSKSNIYLAFVDDGSGRLSRLTSLISPNNYSAISLEDQSVSINCVESRPGSEQRMDCRGLIDVCQMAKIKGNSAKQKAVWLASDMSLTGVNAKLAYSGLKLEA